MTVMIEVDKLKHHTSLFVSMEKSGNPLSYPLSYLVHFAPAENIFCSQMTFV